MAKDLRSTVFKMMEQDALKENKEVSKKEMEAKKDRKQSPKKEEVQKNKKQNQGKKENRNNKKYNSEKKISDKNERYDVKRKASEKQKVKQDTNNNSKSDGTAQKAKSRCPYSKKCGGCQFVDIPYEKQLKKKQQNLQGLLGEFGKLEPIIGMENPDHYRNKVHAVFGLDQKHRPIAGVYEEKTHRVVDVESCFLENEKSTAIIRTIKSLLRSFKIKTYDEDTGYGLLRHVLVRTGFQTGQIMVVLVLGSPILPSKNNFVKALLKEHPEITTIVVNVNNRGTSMILGDKEQVIYGKGYIEDTLCGKKFKISARSFYQVNPVQTEVLYRTAMEFAGLTKNDMVLDCYCGTGTIGIIASDYCKEVVGVELNSSAVADAEKNASDNDCTNISFVCGDSGHFMQKMALSGSKADVVFTDPPRTGSDKRFLESLVRLAPKKIVYISCGIESLERDLLMLCDMGYTVKKIQPVDMFPHTKHVETVVLLMRGDKGARLNTSTSKKKTSYRQYRQPAENQPKKKPYRYNKKH